MTASLGPGSVHHVRSKSRIARSRSDSAIQGTLPPGHSRYKHPRTRANFAALSGTLAAKASKLGDEGVVLAEGDREHGEIDGVPGLDVGDDLGRPRQRVAVVD